MKRKDTTKTIDSSGAKMVISIRLDLNTLENLELFAEKEGMRPTVAAREFIREGIECNGFRLSRETLLEMAENRPSAIQPAAGLDVVIPVTDDIPGFRQVGDENRKSFIYQAHPIGS